MTAPLSDDAADRFVSVARTALGDSLRSLTFFTRTDYEQLYLRDDLEQDADLSSFIGHEWQAFQLTQDTYKGSELGEYQYTVRSFENGFLLRVATERDGVFVTTDGLTVTQFDEAASALESVLEDRRD
ncbi:DUF7522 family protein [Salarchaeum japonicum]|uniref:DUF7522 family protein n=1 Tax=Salarchaeum japonicum TaxID=555573 RepID=UPI003C71AFD8